MFRDTGQRVPNPYIDGQNAILKNGDGVEVIVEATREAIEDKGWPKVIEIALEKYHRGDILRIGPPPSVLVMSSD